MTYRRPPRLRPGDPVAVIAPAGLPRPDDLDRGLALLAERYDVRTFRELRAIEPDGVLAGRDETRAAELAWALGAPELRAVLAVRGGWGTMRALTPGMLAALAEAPRAIVGFSDLTVLLCGALRGAGLVAVHGPMVCQIGRRGKDEALAPLVRLLEQARPPPALGGLEPLAPGRARGPLVGGNLTVLAHLVGTPMMPVLDGAVLLLEDVGERPYRLDRCLTHLMAAGALERVAGVVVGSLTGCEPAAGERGAPELVAERLGRLGVPAAAGLPAGHGRPNLPLPLGVEVELDSEAGVLRFLGPAVE